MDTTATRVAQVLQIMRQSQIIGKMHHHKGNIKNNDGHVGAAYHAAQERGGKNMLKTKEPKGITLISLVITTIFSYDENVKSSNNKGLLPQTI